MPKFLVSFKNRTWLEILTHLPGLSFPRIFTPLFDKNQCLGLKMQKIALSIAGSDPSGGAGVQADLKVFSKFKSYGMGIFTLHTVQNTMGITRVDFIDHNLVLEQMESLANDLAPDAIKTGALGSAEIVDMLAFKLPRLPRACPIVLDPIIKSTSEYSLLSSDAFIILREKLLPLAFICTPNLEEATALSEREVYDVASMRKAAATIALRGVKNVLITGGHLQDEAIDIFWTGGSCYELPANKIPTQHTHGSGCALSAAICANLSQKKSLADSVKFAKEFITQAILTNPQLGKGKGPLNLA